MSTFQFILTNDLFDINDKVSNFNQNNSVIVTPLTENGGDHYTNTDNWNNVQFDDVDGMINDKTSTKKVKSKSAIKKMVKSNINYEPCRVCGEAKNTGLHFGTVTCEACKKFFERYAKSSNKLMKCVRGSSNCIVNSLTRAYCSYCRLKKCLSIGMSLKETVQTQPLTKLPCQVCSAPSSGIHFGVLSCEGCKGFFRRHMNADNLHCMANDNCVINQYSRNECRSCRRKRCIEVGMSENNSMIGRQSNLFRSKLFNNKIENPVPTIQLNISDNQSENDFSDNFDQVSKDIMTTIQTAYSNNIDRNYEIQNGIEQDYLSQVIQCMENHVKCVVLFMMDIKFYLGELHKSPEEIRLISNSVHSLRHLWIHKNNKNINYFNCDDETMELITQMFPCFSSSTKLLQNIHFKVMKEVNMDDQEYSLYSLLVILTGAYQTSLFRSEKSTFISQLKFQISNILGKYMYVRRNEHESYHTLMSLITHYVNVNMELQRSLQSQFMQSSLSVSNMFKHIYLNSGLYNSFSN